MNYKAFALGVAVGFAGTLLLGYLASQLLLEAPPRLRVLDGGKKGPPPRPPAPPVEPEPEA